MSIASQLAVAGKRSSSDGKAAALMLETPDVTSKHKIPAILTAINLFTLNPSRPPVCSLECIPKLRPCQLAITKIAGPRMQTGYLLALESGCLLLAQTTAE
jgi:hypothetical protein